jgi:hypothetical protein
MARQGCRGFDPAPESLATIQRWGAPPTPTENGPESLEEIRRHLIDGRYHCYNIHINDRRQCLI